MVEEYKLVLIFISNYAIIVIRLKINCDTQKPPGPPYIPGKPPPIPPPGGN